MEKLFNSQNLHEPISAKLKEFEDSLEPITKAQMIDCMIPAHSTNKNMPPYHLTPQH